MVPSVGILAVVVYKLGRLAVDKLLVQGKKFVVLVEDKWAAVEDTRAEILAAVVAVVVVQAV